MRRHGTTLVSIFVFVGAALIASCAKPYHEENERYVFVATNISPAGGVDVHVYCSGLQFGAREDPAGASEGVGPREWCLRKRLKRHVARKRNLDSAEKDRSTMPKVETMIYRQIFSAAC